MTDIDIMSKQSVSVAEATKTKDKERKKIQTLLYVAILVGVVLMILFSLWVSFGGDKGQDKTTTVATKREATTLFNEGNYKEAIPKLKVYVEEHPDDAEARAVLGQSYWLDGETDAALKQFQALLQVKPDDADTLYRLGILHGTLNNIDQSVKSLEKAVKIKPDQASYWAELAKAYTRVGKYDEAVDGWKKAFDLTLATNTSYRAGIMAEIGNVYLIKKENDKAVAAFNEGLAIDPDNALLKSQLVKLGQ